MSKNFDFCFEMEVKVDDCILSWNDMVSKTKRMRRRQIVTESQKNSKVGAVIELNVG